MGHIIVLLLGVYYLLEWDRDKRQEREDKIYFDQLWPK